MRARRGTKHVRKWWSQAVFMVFSWSSLFVLLDITAALGQLEELTIYWTERFFLSLLLLVLRLHSLIWVDEGGGGSAWTSPLHWGHAITPSVGCIIATAAFTSVHSWTRVHSFYKSFFQEKDLPSDRFTGGGNQVPALPLTEGLCPYVKAVVNSCTQCFIEEPLVIYNQ